ncbi:MAG: class I SAM-dependent methyltransferase [Methanomassiliicoccales archaeon]
MKAPEREQAEWESIEEDIARISTYYDRAASLISFGMMERWRRKAARETEPWMHVLEVGSGPGSMTKLLHGKEICMLEPDERLLRFSLERLQNEKLRPVLGVVEKLPFPDGTFDAVISSFSFKNFLNRESALGEMGRVLKKGGKAVIVDIAEPDTRIRRYFMRLYMDSILPSLAYATVPRKVKRQWGRNPWKHLSNAYMNLGNPAEVASMAKRAGFSNVSFTYLMTHGVALIVAVR